MPINLSFYHSPLYCLEIGSVSSLFQLGWLASKLSGSSPSAGGYTQLRPAYDVRWSWIPQACRTSVPTH